MRVKEDNFFNEEKIYVPFEFEVVPYLREKRNIGLAEWDVR